MNGNGDKQPDERYVYGANCIWHGSIHEVGLTRGKHQLPCCPKCGGMLFEVESKAAWFVKAAEFGVANSLPMYVEWLMSLRDRPCHGFAGWDWKADYGQFAGKVQ
jgi:hypothetical protein